MAFDITGIGTLVESVTGIIEHFTTDKTEELKINADKVKNELTLALSKLQIELQKQQIEANLLQGQIDINKTEAASPHIFVSGWRPAIGWVCALALTYSYMLYPLLTWICNNVGWTPPIEINQELLSGFALALLGFRTYEKKQGIDTKFNEMSSSIKIKEPNNVATNSIGITVK